jgi:hypothetical protein
MKWPTFDLWMKIFQTKGNKRILNKKISKLHNMWNFDFELGKLGIQYDNLKISINWADYLQQAYLQQTGRFLRKKTHKDAFLKIYPGRGGALFFLHTKIFQRSLRKKIFSIPGKKIFFMKNHLLRQKCFEWCIIWFLDNFYCRKLQNSKQITFNFSFKNVFKKIS